MSLTDPRTGRAAAIPHPSTAPSGSPVVLACVEVGASSTQTALLDSFGRFSFKPGVAVPAGVPVLAASPGLIRGTHVVAASNLGWFDIGVADALGLDCTVSLLRNDAEAAALGEQVLRGTPGDLVYVGLGTGVGGAVVTSGSITSNLFGHLGGFGDRACACGSRGCLETVAAGWALGEPASQAELETAATALAQAIRREPLSTSRLVVVAGGLASRHPQLLELIAAALPDRDVEPSAAPPEAKSAAAWGLLHLHRLTPHTG